MPVCRSTLTTSTSQAANSSINYQRFRAGIAPLRLYSTHEDLADCIENELVANGFMNSFLIIN